MNNALKTTVLLAGLGGLILVVGSLFGASGPGTSACTSLSSVGGSYWFSDRSPSPRPGQAAGRGRAARVPPIMRDLRPAGRHADARALRHPRPPAQRLRHRTQPPPRRRGRHRRASSSTSAGTRSGACWPTSRPRAQPRHPDRLGGGGDRHGHHVRGPHGHVGRDLRRWPRQTSDNPLGLPGHDHPGAGRRHVPADGLSAAAASSRPTAPAPSSSATASRWPGRWRGSTAARKRFPSSVRPGPGAGLHREPAAGRKTGFANLFTTHPPMEERIRPPARGRVEVLSAGALAGRTGLAPRCRLQSGSS